jgi:hypothetical protein
VHRDAWASHPTQVIVWLPAWGLREFKDLAPDLFHWCRSLTILHDADLPVRDELEYLIWACERYRHAGDGPALPGYVRSGARGDLWLAVDPTEREILGTRATHAMATARLRMQGGRLDVDVLGEPRGDAGEARVPVLIRAIDAAGHLEVERGLAGIVGAAGIPGDDETASVFVALAEADALVCLFDGFAYASRTNAWFAWLERTYPRIRTVWVLADEAASSADLWDAGRAPRDRRLDELLARLFPAAEAIVGFASFLFGEEIVGVLPDVEDVGVAGWRAAFVRACEERRLIDAGFFNELRRMRPTATAEIDAVAGDYLAG